MQNNIIIKGSSKQQQRKSPMTTTMSQVYGPGLKGQGHFQPGQNAITKTEQKTENQKPKT